ncbi:MAG: ATP-binding protein [Bacteroidota bacterium]
MINKTTIYNYRSCLETEVALHPELTVMIGANGVGKSNILKAIYSFTKIERANKSIPKLPKNASSFVNPTVELKILTKENKTYQLKANLLIEEDKQNQDLIKRAVISYKPSNGKPDYELMTFDLLDGAHYLYDDQGDYSHAGRAKFEEVLSIVKSFKNISYYSASQFANSQNCPISIEISQVVFGAKKTSENHSEFFENLYRTFKDNPTLFEQYIFLIGKEGLNLVESIDFSVQKIPNQNGRLREIVTLSAKVDGLNLLFNQLSDGTFRTLALIFYLLSDENDVLLIEEPEISVHHGLLLSIMELIKQESKRKQIVISTHSDFVLDQVAPENVVLVTKDREKGTLAKPLSKSMSESEYKLLKEYLETEGNLGEYWRETDWEHE